MSTQCASRAYSTHRKVRACGTTAAGSRQAPCGCLAPRARPTALACSPARRNPTWREGGRGPTASGSALEQKSVSGPLQATRVVSRQAKLCARTGSALQCGAVRQWCEPLNRAQRTTACCWYRPKSCHMRCPGWFTARKRGPGRCAPCGSAHARVSGQERAHVHKPARGLNVQAVPARAFIPRAVLAQIVAGFRALLSAGWNSSNAMRSMSSCSWLQTDAQRPTPHDPTEEPTGENDGSAGYE